MDMSAMPRQSSEERPAIKWQQDRFAVRTIDLMANSHNMPEIINTNKDAYA